MKQFIQFYANSPFITVSISQFLISGLAGKTVPVFAGGNSEIIFKCPCKMFWIAISYAHGNIMDAVYRIVQELQSLFHACFYQIIGIIHTGFILE